MNKEEKKIVSETQAWYGFANKTEDEKLLEAARKPDIIKLQLFTRMLRRNKMLDKARIISKL